MVLYMSCWDHHSYIESEVVIIYFMGFSSFIKLAIIQKILFSEDSDTLVKLLILWFLAKFFEIIAFYEARKVVSFQSPNNGFS